MKFKKSATKLKNRMWWQNKKMCLLLFAVLAIIILIIARLSPGCLALAHRTLSRRVVQDQVAAGCCC